MKIEAVPRSPNHELATVTVRLVQPQDASLLYAMYDRLSLESIYARYLSYRRPQLDELAALTAMLPAQGTGVVATVGEAGARLVGMAYYLRETAQPAAKAELAILVEDQFQGIGIGRLLCAAIIQRARLQQINQLRVLFHYSNQRVWRLIQTSGCAYQAGVNDGLNDFTLFPGHTTATII